MSIVSLVHWNEEEGRKRVAELEARGFQVDFHSSDAGKSLGIFKTRPPAAIIIDLSRAPAQGRDLAVALRIFTGTRHVPLLFAGGQPEKVANVRSVLPDATFATWVGIEGPLREVMDQPPQNPSVPDSALAGYSGTPLPKKLGIKEGFRVLVARGPEGISDTLGSLPRRVRLVTRFGPKVDLILWFVRSERELESEIGKWASRVGPGGMWIMWIKKSSPAYSGLKQATVRKVGLANGLVDYKIAAVDETWSGLKFAVRAHS